MTGKQSVLTLDAIHIPSQTHSESFTDTRGRPLEVDCWTVTLTVTENWGSIPAGQQLGALVPPRTMTTPFTRGSGLRKYHPSHGPKGGVRLRQAAWGEQAPGKLATFAQLPEYRGLSSPPYLYAMPPTVGEVLECLVSDSMLLDEYRDEAEWLASEMHGEMLNNAAGVRKAIQQYHAVCQEDDNLRRLLSDRYEIVLRSGPDEGWSSIKSPEIILPEVP